MDANEARIDEYLDDLDRQLEFEEDDEFASALALVEDAAARHNMTISRLIPWGRDRGWSITFAWTVNDTYTKYLQTDRFPTLREALSHAYNILLEDDLMASIFKVGDLFKYLTAEMFTEGKSYTMEISKVDIETIKNQSGEKIRAVLFFKGTDKGFIVSNKTNARVLARLHTDDYETWPGKQISLTTEWGTFFGQRQRVIRIEDKIPQKGSKKSGGDSLE